MVVVVLGATMENVAMGIVVIGLAAQSPLNSFRQVCKKII